MPERKRVLITGATGYIASLILPKLRDHYDLTMIDIRTTERNGDEVPGVQIVNLLNEDRSSLQELFTGVDTVVHCGYIHPRPDAVYEDERKNVDMMQRVYELASSCGVERVVAASTNQASKWYEHPYHAGLLDRVTPDDYPRPESFYGWAKAAYESMGFVYACGSLGPKLGVIQIRIVAPREIAASDFADKPTSAYLRDIAGYISHRDLQQLFVKSIDAPEIDDEFGVSFQIFYGVSNNARTFWSITNARKVIGYQPEDDSEVKFADDIRQMLQRPT